MGLVFIKKVLDVIHVHVQVLVSVVHMIIQEVLGIVIEVFLWLFRRPHLTGSKEP